MEFHQFEQQIKEDPELSAFVQDVAGEISAEMPTEETDRYVAGVDDVLLGLVAYILFRGAKDYFDNKRDERETEIAERRARIIKGFVEDGFAPKQAQAATEGLFKQIAKRTEDDPVFQKAVALIGQGGS